MAAYTPELASSATVAAEWRRGLPDLVCEGIRLRELRLADADQLAAAFGPEESAALGVAPPATSDHWLQFVAKARTSRLAGHSACFGAVRAAAPGICGLVLLRRLAPSSGVATASFVFPDGEWQTDLPHHSLACALGFAFRAVGVGRVEGRASGARELELVRRIGAVEEGVLRRSRRRADGVCDQTLWSILDAEWAHRGDGAAAGLVHIVCAPPSPDDLLNGPGESPPDWTSCLPVMKGSLVTLREVALLDVPVLLRALEPSDLEVAIEPAPKTSNDLRRYVAWVQLQRTMGRAAGFAIVPRGTRHAAGLIQVRRDDPSGLTAEWGIALASRYRGTGTAVEAVQLMAGFAFETLGVERLEARASGIDPRSVGLLRKIGAVREAHLRRSFVRGDEALDDDLWAILEADWRGARATSDIRTMHEKGSAAG